MENKIPTDELFFGLVLSLSQSAYISLGKLPDPMSGKIERNLDQAGQTIDLLAALEEKTKGNLKEEEAKFMQQTISELRLNYVDESNKPAEADKKDEAVPAQAPEDTKDTAAPDEAVEEKSETTEK